VDSKLIEKYFRGECSPEEVAQVLAWFEKEDLDPDQEQDLYRFWEEAGQEKQHPEFSREAARILDGINRAIDGQQGESFQVNDQEPAAQIIPVKSRWNGWYQAAAAVLILLGGWWAYGTYFSPAGRAPAAKYITLQAPAGARRTINLADGSVITLNAGSRITYQQPLPRHTREIQLMGEAFFEVAKDPQRPFIVKTGSISTQALGTSFNIKYRSKEQDISVALATGSVKIAAAATGGSNPIARLKPGQQLVYNRADHGYQVRAYDPEEVMAWRQGVLYFKKATLNQVVEQLETWYGVEIEIKGPVSGKASEWRYTGAYDNQSLDDVLAGISFVKDFTYEKQGNKMILKFN
jgi:transmembrane sensor